MTGALNGLLDLFDEMWRNALKGAEMMYSYPFLREIVDFAIKELSEERHQALDFEGGTPPIFSREGVEREKRHSYVSGGPNDGTNVLDTGAMTGMARKTMLFRPPTIAIHDDGNVSGNAL